MTTTPFMASIGSGPSFDAAISAKCKEMKAPSKVQRFADKIKWLGERAVISADQQSRWKQFGIYVMSLTIHQIKVSRRPAKH